MEKEAIERGREQKSKGKANPRSSSPSPMNSQKTEDDLFLESQPSILLLSQMASSNPNPNPNPNPIISPEAHISSQFYTFNHASHSLMLRCLSSSRIASAAEIRAATPAPLLSSWRSVWKDRNQDTAYVTAWKRIQDKLSITTTGPHHHSLCFKNNPKHLVPYVEQWQSIVTSFHVDNDTGGAHLGVKETIEKIKQVWTVGAKFYGIPESYIRVCVAACSICNTSSLNSGMSVMSNNKRRRRFEYTESIEVAASEVPTILQQLAVKHKVVLCIRQKYIRYKPFMAEVKDYACHRAGSSSKSSKIMKREPYVSKRCGCGFRIRAIVPIADYNEKEKTFVYQEEGVAVFKLYAVHSGHEPGPLDGNARIMHRVMGTKGGGFLMDNETTVYGVNDDEFDNEGFGLLRKDEGDLRHSVLQQVKELRAEVGCLEENLAKLPVEVLGSVSRDMFDIVNRVRHIGEGSSKTMSLMQDKIESDDILVGEDDLAHWDHQERLYRDGHDADLIEDDEDSFAQTLGDVPWEQMSADCRSQKDLISEACKSGKWLKCSDFDEKGILDCHDTKLTKTLSQEESIVTDVGLIDSFYQGSSKWYDSPCGLDPGADCGDSAFRHGGAA